MKTIKFILKTYLIFLIYIVLYSLFYSLYIHKTLSNINLLIPLIFGSIGYLLLSFIWCNHIHKKGLLFGLLISILHIILLTLINFLITNQFDANFIQLGIFALMGGIGGIIGTNIKKIF